MPATVHVSESTRASMRVIITIAALVVLLVPIAFSVAHGASRLNYAKLDVTKPLSTSVTDLKFLLDTTASVTVKTTETDEPTVRLTATGPRDEAPTPQVREAEDSSTVSVDDQRNLENAQIEVTLPAKISKEMKLDFNGGYGAIEVVGDYQEIVAKTDGGAVDVSGSAERLQTSTDYGMTDLSGTFDTIESKTGVGTLNGSNLNVRDHVDAVTSTGTIDLDFTNDMVPMSGIVAKADEGTIDIRLPRLTWPRRGWPPRPPLPRMTMAVPLTPRICSTASTRTRMGSVDLAKDVKKYDAARSSKDAEGKTIIPVSASTDMGTITIEQN